MRIRDLMARKVSCCHRHARLNEVSHIMWQEDTGIVPVVDQEHRVVGVVTDRDVCMAAYTTGRPLAELTAEGAMSRTVHACQETDNTENAHRLMRELQVRRLPVVDKDRKLTGLIGLSDLARVAGEDPLTAREFAATFAEVSRPRKFAESRVVRAAPPLRPAADKPAARQPSKSSK